MADTHIGGRYDLNTANGIAAAMNDLLGIRNALDARLQQVRNNVRPSPVRQQTPEEDDLEDQLEIQPESPAVSLRASPGDSGLHTPVREGDPMDVSNAPNIRDSPVPVYDSRGQVIARNTRGSPIVTPLGVRYTRFGSTPPRTVTPNSLR